MRTCSDALLPPSISFATKRLRFLWFFDARKVAIKSVEVAGVAFGFVSAKIKPLPQAGEGPHASTAGVLDVFEEVRVRGAGCSVVQEAARSARRMPSRFIRLRRVLG